MNKIPITQDVIFEFSCEPGMCEEYLDKVIKDPKIKFIDTISKNSTDSSNLKIIGPSSKVGYPIPKDQNLMNWFQECIDQVSMYRFDKKNQMICDAWLTKTTFGQQSTRHNHYNSIFSGLFYLNDNKTSTKFFPADYFSYVYGLPKTFNTIINQYDIEYFPKAGTLLIFPSYLYHKISVSKEKITRYTLAFNTFFSGNLNSVHTGLLSLSVDQKPYQEGFS